MTSTRIVNLRPRSNQHGDYYTFSLLTDWHGHNIEARGWQYWPQDGRVRGPRVRVNNDWREVHALTDAAREDIAEAVRLELVPVEIRAGTLEVPPKIWEAYCLDPGRFIYEHPEWYRRLYIESMPEDAKRAFDALSEDRNWPDEYLEHLAGHLENGDMTAGELQFQVSHGVVLPRDLERMEEIVKERK